MNLIRTAIAGILSLLAISSAAAQQFSTLPANSVVGRLGISSGPAQAIPFGVFQQAVSGPCATATPGLVPATGGGTTNFLRSDCTFANPVPPISNNTLLANVSGVSAQPTSTTPGGLWNSFCSSTIGNFWVRQTSGWGCTALGYANPVWWGADPTDTNDSAAAFTSAFAASSNVVVPPGTYRINTAISYTMPNGAGWSTSSTTSNTIGTGAKTFTVASCTGVVNADTVTASTLSSGTWVFMAGTVTSCISTTLIANITSVSGAGTFATWSVQKNYQAKNFVQKFRMSGSGNDVTTLHFPNGTNGFVFALSSQQHSLDISDLTITTDAQGSGNAFTVTNSYNFFGTFTPTSHFVRVTCRGSDGYAAADYWTKCVSLANVSDVNFIGLKAVGDSTATHGTGVDITQAGAGCFTVPMTCGTNYFFSESYLYFLGTGINYGANTQSVSFVNSICAQVADCIGVVASAGSIQELNVSASRFYPTQHAIVGLTAVPNLLVSNNLMACGTGFYCIDILQQNGSIIGNNFIARNAANTPAGGIKVSVGTTSALQITGNTFSSVGQAQLYAASTSGISTQSNAYNANTATVSNSGTNTVGGGTQ